MTGNKKSRKADERLDHIGRELVRASVADEAEIQSAASSPFLYARIKARINAEVERRAARESWLAVLGVVWRAVPAMALIAVFALVMFLSTSLNRQVASNANDYMLVDGSGNEVEGVVFADSRSLSSDDVLESIMSEDEQEASK